MLAKTRAQPPQNYNHDLLALMPLDAAQVVEVGCNNGALAYAYKQKNPSCYYTGIEIDLSHAISASQFCDRLLNLDIETAGDEFYDHFADANLWVFGDVLEHLRDPWRVLAKIRRVLPAGGCVAVCLPNAQHWSLQLRLNIGDWRYEDSGLLDRTHVRFFTRVTMLEMFANTGFRIEQGFPRIAGELTNPDAIAAIKAMAASVGADPEQAYQDCLPIQYVLRAVAA